MEEYNNRLLKLQQNGELLTPKEIVSKVKKQKGLNWKDVVMMKIKVVGSGSMRTHFNSASYLIDDNILMECVKIYLKCILIQEK